MTKIVKPSRADEFSDDKIGRPSLNYISRMCDENAKLNLINAQLGVQIEELKAENKILKDCLELLRKKVPQLVELAEERQRVERSDN